MTYSGWRLIVAQLPSGLQYPLDVNFLDFLVINPSSHLSGDLYISDLKALYSPGPRRRSTTCPSRATPDDSSTWRARLP